jgi:hypothetical protein
MLLTVALSGPAGHEESVAVDANGANLAYLLQQYTSAVEACLINGRLHGDWQNYIPQKGDRVKLVLTIQEAITLLLGGGIGGAIFGAGTAAAVVPM